MTARKGGEQSPPAAERFVTPEWINATLHAHFEHGHNGGIDLPDAVVWVFLAARINNYIRDPWNNHQSALLTRNARQMQTERSILEQAARILESDRDRVPNTEAFGEFRNQWSAAISVLRCPRGATDNPRDQLARRMHPQRSMTAWAFVARDLMPDLVVISVRRRATVRATPGNGIIKTLIDILRLIFPSEKLPAQTTICRALKDDIDKYVKIAKTDPNTHFL